MTPLKEAQAILQLAIFLVSFSKAVCQENVSVQPTKVEELILDSDFIDPLNVSCTRRDECQSHRKEEEDNLSDNSCECGEQCIDHDTCCIDSPHLERMNRNRYQEMCTRVVHSDLCVFMVTSCKTEWNGDLLTRSLCESDPDTLKDPTGFLPVTSSITNVTYKNFFCAVCNDDHEEIVFWQISFAFEDFEDFLEDYNNRWSISDLAYNGETKSWDIIVEGEDTENKELRPVILQIVIPEKLIPVVKSCYPNLISSCDPTWRDVTSIERCEEYMDPIAIYPEFNYEPKVFRNVHCAVCNYVKDFRFYHCVKSSKTTSTEFSFTDIELMPGGIPVVYSAEDDKIPSLGRPFYILINFNKNDREEVKLPPKCENGKVYDELFKKCRRLSCSQPGFIIRNGRCVKG